MATFWQDLRHSLRMLSKRPGFTLTVVITLALGIGGNATIFTWIKAILLDPLPGIERPDQLVEIWGATRHNSALSTSYLDYLDFRDRNTALSRLAAHQMLAMNLGRGEKPERVRGAVVSGNYFDVLGVKALIGRTFLPEEDRTPNSHPVVVIGYGLWQRRFGSDPQVIGQRITLNEHDFTIIGVTPADFGSPFPGNAIDVWTPVMMKDYVARPHFSLTDRGSRWLMVIGRLKSGATVSQAQANIAAIARQLEEAYPRTNEQLGVEVYSVEQSPYSLKRSLQSSLAILMAAVAVVLLIACANVANLLLARAASRRKEIAVRVALGGRRLRLVRQMLTESLVLAAIGAGVGLTLAFWAARFLPAFLPPYAAGGFNARPDASVFAFTAALTVITTALFGLAPTLQASRPDLVTALKETTAMIGRGTHRVSLRHGLVVTQVALSMVALISAGLFVRSLREAYNANPGFDPHHVLLAALDPFLSGYDESRGREFYRHLIERVGNLPGVQSATLARRLPLTLGGIAFANVTIDGYAPASEEDMRLNYETVGPHYFQTMRIPLVHGRDFDERDNERAQRVVVINETMAHRYWHKGGALGQRLKLTTNDWLEIVGIAKDVKNRSLSEAAQPFLYLPLFQDYRSNMILVTRTAMNPDQAVHAVQSVIAERDTGVPVFDVKTFEEHMGVSLFQQRMASTLLSIFGLLALALAALGLYGVMAYAVSQRTRELGIRISIGAGRGEVLKLILGLAVMLAAIGITGGLVTALAVTRFAANLLYGISPADPLTFTSIPVMLLAVALAAGYFPARRATRIDPMIALRSE